MNTHLRCYARCWIRQLATFVCRPSLTHVRTYLSTTLSTSFIWYVIELFCSLLILLSILIQRKTVFRINALMRMMWLLWPIGECNAVQKGNHSSIAQWMGLRHSMVASCSLWAVTIQVLYILHLIFPVGTIESFWIIILTTRAMSPTTRWRTLFLKPSDKVVVLDSEDPDSSLFLLVLVFRFWDAIGEDSKFRFLLSKVAFDDSDQPRTLTQSSIPNFIPRLSNSDARQLVAVRKVLPMPSSSGMSPATISSPTAIVGKLDNGERYSLYRFLLHWDKFQVSSGGVETNLNALYLLPMNLNYDSRNSADTARLLSVAQRLFILMNLCKLSRRILKKVLWTVSKQLVLVGNPFVLSYYFLVRLVILARRKKLLMYADQLVPATVTCATSDGRRSNKQDRTSWIPSIEPHSQDRRELCWST